MNSVATNPTSDSGFVLVVDDEAGVRRVVTRALQRRGDRVLQARDIDEALALLEQWGSRLDLLITDLTLPDGCGVDLARAAQALRPELRTIFISGDPDSERLRPCRSSGWPLVAKPFRMKSLRHVVELVLDNEAPGYFFVPPLSQQLVVEAKPSRDVTFEMGLEPLPAPVG